MDKSKKDVGDTNKINFGKCKICPADAVGIHSGVKTCGGCKFFFRRSIENNATYACLEMSSDKFNKCEIGIKLPKCRHCRLRKCLEVGMKIGMIGTRRSRSSCSLKKTEKESSAQNNRKDLEVYSKIEKYTRWVDASTYNIFWSVILTYFCESFNFQKRYKTLFQPS